MWIQCQDKYFWHQPVTTTNLKLRSHFKPWCSVWIYWIRFFFFCCSVHIFFKCGQYEIPEWTGHSTTRPTCGKNQNKELSQACTALNMEADWYIVGWFYWPILVYHRYVSTYVSADMKLQKLCRFINLVTSLLFTSILPNIGIRIGP